MHNTKQPSDNTSTDETKLDKPLKTYNVLEHIQSLNLTPKEQVAAALITTNPDSPKREIARLLADLGLYSHEQSAVHILRPGTKLDQLKKALQFYAHESLVAPAYKIHHSKLQSLKEKAEKDPEKLTLTDGKWVFAAEKLAGETINIDVQEHVQVGVVHAMLQDFLPSRGGEEGVKKLDVLNKDTKEHTKTRKTKPK